MAQILARYRPFAILIELQYDLVAIVDESGLRVNHAVAVEVDIFADPAVFRVVEVIDHLGSIAAIFGVIGDLRQPVASIPRVLRDLRVAVGERLTLIHIDIPRRAVAFGVVGVPIRAVGEEATLQAVLNGILLLYLLII